MNKSLLIGLATAALVATSVVGVGVANALQVSSSLGATAVTEKVGYYWRGYWRPYAGYAPVYGAVCPLRKVWVDTRKGPRLKWVRVCRPF